MWKLVSTYVETKLKGFYARGKLNSLSIGLKALNCIAWGRVTEGNAALGRRYDYHAPPQRGIIVSGQRPNALA